MPSLLQAWALPATLLAIVNISATWFNLVSSKIPEPYLDEFFHVPQAAKFCKGDYSWDPKITTPPGLYLLTKVLEPFLGCDTSSMRALNAGAICIMCLLSYGILRLFLAPNSTSPTSQKQKKTAQSNEKQLSEDDPTAVLDAHSAFNIALFPPLFFFSALYYTDVVSTLVVLFTYSALIKKQTPAGTIFENINTVYLGVMAVLCRQTNIFWVAILPAGLAVVDALSPSKNDTGKSEGRTMTNVLKDSWDSGTVYDCPAQNAGLQDYICFVLSIVPAALRKPLVVLRVALSYIILLALFAGFVIWNGGVVLGDKTAHVATLHVPQMLYIWPYFAFFSAPLLVGPLLRPFVPILPKQLQALCEDCFGTTIKAPLPSFLMCALFIAGGIVAVHFNTIIHPYTLADNRHYVFYVFRILRRQQAIKYLAVPVYFICAWLCIQLLSPPDVEHKSSKKKSDVSPAVSQAARPSCKISFIVIWLATTTLSVITAPLVEPRYFIIPWVIWRLHVPYTSASTSTSRGNGKTPYDIRLVLETAWYGVINVAVGYMFLYKGFDWPSEPGKVQRFLW